MLPGPWESWAPLQPHCGTYAKISGVSGTCPEIYFIETGWKKIAVNLVPPPTSISPLRVSLGYAESNYHRTTHPCFVNHVL